MPLMDLRRVVGMPPQTTLRKNLRTLTELDVLRRHREGDFPGAVEYELGEAGRNLIPLLRVLDSWLQGHPDGAIELGSITSRAVIKALVDGWSTSAPRALAARPLSLTELSRLISGINYPTLERRLRAMRLTGLIKPRPGGGRSRPYIATEWLRRAVAPLAAAAEWERRNETEAPPIGRIDVEAAFLLSLPPLQLPQDLSGTVKLVVEISGGDSEPNLAGVLATVTNGRVCACSASLRGSADCWASGSVGSWLSAVMDLDADLLEFGGDTELARALLDRLSEQFLPNRQLA